MLYPIFKIIRYIFLYPIKKIQEIFSYKKKFEYLTTLVEPSDLKTPDGPLKDAQIRYLEFAKEFMQIADKIGIKPFLSCGTLLGAIRHGGYIPWDDDIDFGLMRDDYDKLIEYAKTNCIFIKRRMNRFWSINRILKFEDKIIKQNPDKLIFILSSECLQLYKGTSLKDFAILDFFPYDFYDDDYSFEEHKSYVLKLHKKAEQINNYPKESDFMEKERLSNPKIGHGKNIGFSIDSALNLIYRRTYSSWFRYEEVFPLKKVRFENDTFWAPNAPETFLVNLFGKNWNKLPKDFGYSHHRELIDNYIKKYYG